jgi:metallophosphoesterase superfamily enzyme
MALTRRRRLFVVPAFGDLAFGAWVSRIVEPAAPRLN